MGQLGDIINFFFTYNLSILHVEPWCVPAGYSLASIHPSWTQRWMGPNWLLLFYTSIKNKKQKKTNRQDEIMTAQTQTQTMIFFLQPDSWPQCLVVVCSAREEVSLRKQSPFTVQKGFQAIAGTRKSIKWLRNGSFLIDCSRRTQATGLLKAVYFVDQLMMVSIHKFLSSCHDVICYRESGLLLFLLWPDSGLDKQYSKHVAAWKKL